MADDESLKTATLKKAYAEIILDTSKEAAARIMAADRKALSKEKELFALKQEALRMLVQLKRTLDSKNAEAEVRSMNQQKKVEELEAQLSEAEGIIVDLREELRLTQDKLEKLEISQKQHLKQHALEDYEALQLISESELIEQTYDKNYRTVEYLSSANECSTKSPAEIALHCAFRDQHVRAGQEQSATPSQISMLSHCDASLDTYHGVKSGRDQCSSCSSESDERDKKSSCNGSEAKPLEYESHYFQAVRDGFRRPRKDVKYQEAIAALRSCPRGRRARSCQPLSFPPCRISSGTQNEEASIELPDSNAVGPTRGSCHITSSCEMNYSDDTAIERFKEFRDKSSCGEKEEDATIQISEGSESISYRVDNDKALKFTFQRKRKKEVLAKLDHNISPERNMTLSEQGQAAKLQKTIVNDEHVKDNNGQLLQVARQLIALSGNGHA